MEPSREEVEAMVGALFTLSAGLDRARRRSPGAARLSLLQLIEGRLGVRPSDIAAELQVSPSLVTRQVQALEREGLLAVALDPADHRSCRISLTQAGNDAVHRLREFGIGRFQSFVAGWDASEVVTFTRLLQKFELDKGAIGAAEARRAERPRWARSTS